MSGLGLDDLDQNNGAPDYERGAGGEPMVTHPETGKRVRHARTSGASKPLEEESALTNWRIAKAMEGMANRPELVAHVKTITPYEDHKSQWTKAREDAIQAGRGAYRADMGTAWHAMSHRWEQEPEYDPGSPYREALETFEQGRDDLGLVSAYIEVPIANFEFKMSGTCDRLFRTTKPLIAPDDTIIGVGDHVVGDIKTGKSLEFSLPGYTCQLAGYAGGVLYDVVNNRVADEQPEIRQDWGVIIHVDVEGNHVQWVWCDLTVGRYGLELAEQVKEWRRAWRRKDGYSASAVDVLLAPDDAPAPEPVQTFRETAQQHVAATRPAPDDLDAWRASLRDRIARIREHPEAKQWMLARWPADLVPPKKISSLDEAHRLDAFLGRVETEYQFPFPEGVPRVEAAS